MDLQQLTYFVAVAEEGSFTRGADREHVVQSTVSAAVGRLERELGQSLFYRTEHRIALTEAGALLLHRARSLLAGARDLREELASMGGPVRGTVTLGMVMSAGTLDLGRILSTLRREHPAVQVRVQISSLKHERQIGEVADGTYDLALVPEPDRPTPGVTMVQVGRLELLLTAAVDADLPADPMRCADLAGAVFIDFPAAWTNRIRTDDFFAAAGIHRDVVIEVTDAATAIDLVRTGLGLAFLPRRLVEGRTDLRVVALDAPPPSRALVLARSAAPQRPAVEALYQLVLRESVPQS